MSHFAAIGFGATREALHEAVLAAIDRSGPAPGLETHAASERWFHDPAGPAMAIHLGAPGAVACVTPGFAAPDGGTRWRVRTTAAHVDATCAHCSGADCDVLDGDGELVTRAAGQWLFFEPYRAWLAAEREYDLAIVGFASTLHLASTPDDLERIQAGVFGPRDPAAPVQPGAPLRLGDRAFLPFGMFGHEGDVGRRATAVLTGTVSLLATPHNTLTGRRFVHARIATLGGSLDVVAPEEALRDAPADPRLALADVWLVGRPVERPPARG